MKVPLLCALLWCWVFIVNADDEITVVRGNGDYFPKEYIQDARLTGLHIDLLNSVSDELGVTIKFESLPWKRAIQALKQGDVDAITYLSRTAERDEFAWFLKGNILSSSQVYPVILAQRKTEIHYDGSMQSLRPYLIAVGDGYQYGEPFDSATGLVKYVVSPPEQAKFPELLSRFRVDIIISSRRHLQKLYSADEIDRTYYIFPQPVASDNSYIAFSKAKDNYELAKKFGKGRRQFKTSGAYLQIVEHYKYLEQSR